LESIGTYQLFKGAEFQMLNVHSISNLNIVDLENFYCKIILKLTFPAETSKDVTAVPLMKVTPFDM
jgi:hypothetical protein